MRAYCRGLQIDLGKEAESEEQALALYNRGHYSDYDYDMDDLFYDHTFVSIREEETEPVNYYQGA